MCCAVLDPAPCCSCGLLPVWSVTCVSFVTSPQPVAEASQATVSVTALMEAMVTFGLQEREEALADDLVELGLEDTVPLKDIVKLLKAGGVPSAQALKVKAALVAPPALVCDRSAKTCSPPPRCTLPSAAVVGLAAWDCTELCCVGLTCDHAAACISCCPTSHTTN
jgi:hypothetical protein